MTLQTATRWYASVLLLGIAVAGWGCRRRDPYTDGVLEITRAEKMDLEDQIYALEDKLAEKERELEALRGRKPSSSVPAPRTPRSTPPAVMPDEELVPPAIDPGIPSPRIELPPVEATPSSSNLLRPKGTIKPASHTAEQTRRLEEALPPAEDEQVDDSQAMAPSAAIGQVAQASFRRPATEEEVEDTEVTQLFINPFQTMGVELDQQPGDDGINLLCEPRNAAGQYVPQAGQMTIVVLDSALGGEAARIARWELTKTEVSKRLLDTRPDRGIKVQLKWPEQRPQHGKLKLFVRFETNDGRQVEAASDVFIELPGELSQRWTPRREQ